MRASGAALLLLGDGLEEFPPCDLELLGGVVVGLGGGESVQLFEAEALLEVLVGVGQRLEFLIRRHHGAIRIALALLALGVGRDFGEEAGPVEVEVRVQVLAVEGVEARGVFLWQMRIAPVFAHDRAVLALDQRVVVAVA